MKGEIKNNKKYNNDSRQRRPTRLPRLVPINRDGGQVSNGVGVKVSEIFESIQGESTYAGLPCVFIRLSGCNLRCSYCDTRYVFEEGKEMSIDEILSRLKGKGQKLVEITGGEPLLQEGVYKLTRELLDKDFEVLIETNGSIDIGKLDEKVIRIVDLLF